MSCGCGICHNCKEKLEGKLCGLCDTTFALTEVPMSDGYAWNFSINGEGQTLNIPKEHITHLSLNRREKSFRYFNEEEREENILVRDMLGLGRLGDLSDVLDRAGGNTSILVKNAADGCIDCGGSAADKWETFVPSKSIVPSASSILGLDSSGNMAALGAPDPASRSYLFGWKTGDGYHAFFPESIDNPLGSGAQIVSMTPNGDVYRADAASYISSVYSSNVDAVSNNIVITNGEGSGDLTTSIVNPLTYSARPTVIMQLVAGASDPAAASAVYSPSISINFLSEDAGLDETFYYAGVYHPYDHSHDISVPLPHIAPGKSITIKATAQFTGVTFGVARLVFRNIKVNWSTL